MPWPPGLSAVAIRCCPRALRQEAMQEAWLACCEGRNPDSAVRQFVRREQRHRASHPDLSRLAPGRIARMF